LSDFANRLRDAIRDDRKRRWGYAWVLLILAILTVFPRPYVSRAKLVPQDTSASAASTTALLGALGSNTQSIGSLLTGGRPSNDLYLLIGRSDSVAEDVIRKLKLVGPSGYSTMNRAKIALSRRVDVHSLLGGAMEITTKTHDPDFSQRITEAYVESISKQLASFGKQIVTNKQRIVSQRFSGSMQRIARAESILNNFRRKHNLADPELELGTALALRAQLQGALQSKIAELQAMRQLKGPESPEVVAAQTEIGALSSQIAQSAKPSNGAGGPSLAGLTAVQTAYLNLYRDYRFAQSNYEVYARSLEQVEVEQLAAESASYVQIIDPAHLDAKRQFNISALAALLLVLLIAAFTEIYAPMTGLYQPYRSHEPD